MDPITQAALGATVGQIGFQRQLGRRALFWGALVAMLPDLDMIVKWFADPMAMFKYHRGVTHSILAGPIIGLTLGYILWYWLDKNKRQDTMRAWIGLGIWAIVTHPLLDYFTIYGTQLLAPICDHRFYVPAVCVIDPIYTFLLFFSILVGVIFHRKPRVYIAAASIFVTLSTGYLFYGVIINTQAEKIAKMQLQESGQRYNCLRSYTTLLQPVLRRVVVHTEDEVLIGLVSTWSPKPINWHRYKKAKIPAISQLKNHEMGKTFAWFSGGDNLFRIIHVKGHKYLEMHDLRYGIPPRNITSIWSLRAEVNDAGELISEPIKVKVHHQINNNFLRTLFVGAYG